MFAAYAVAVPWRVDPASVAEEEEIIKRPNLVTLPDSLETVEHWLVETDTDIAELIRMTTNESSHGDRTWSKGGCLATFI